MTTPTLADRVWETGTTTGTGSFTLDGAIARYRTFNEAIGQGIDLHYIIVHETQDEWETGIGQLSDSTTLSRNTVVESSNSGSLVNFSAGTKNVFVGAVAKKIAVLDENNEINVGWLPILDESQGAIGITTYDTGDLIYAVGQNNLGILSAGNNGDVLRLESGIPSWHDLDTDDVDEGVSNLYHTDERVDDRVASLLIGGTNVTVTYDDGAGTLDVDVSPQGSGSNLNADTVDGEHASAFADASHTHPGSDITSQVGDADTVDGLHASEISAQTATNLDNTDDLDTLNDGWYAWTSSVPANAPDGKNYMIMIQQSDASQKQQLAFGGDSFGDVYVRRADGGTFYSWTQFWSDANDGSGSGLDADTVDGEHANAFADASHTHPGSDITSQVGDADTVDGYHANEGNAASTVAARDSAGDISARLFRPEYTSLNTGTNIAYFWTSRETGTGNNYLRPTTRAAVLSQLEADGINADTVDGEHASAFADAGHTHALGDLSDVTATGEGSGGGFDADTVDGQHAADIGGGGIVPLASYSPSGVSSVDITSQIDSTYDEYLIVLQHVHPATDQVQLYLRTSSDGGSTWDSGSSDYSYKVIDDSSLFSQDSSFIRLNAAQVRNPNGDVGLSGWVRLVKPSSSSEWTFVWGDVAFEQGNDGFPQPERNGFSGFRKELSSVDGIRFLFSSGNVSSGLIKLYGVVNP